MNRENDYEFTLIFGRAAGARERSDVLRALGAIGRRVSIGIPRSFYDAEIVEIGADAVLVRQGDRVHTAVYPAIEQIMFFSE